MKGFSRGFATVLAATMVVSGMCFAPAYAEETEVTEPVGTQEMVQTDAGFEAGEGLDAGAGETGEMVNPANSIKIVSGMTSDGDYITREVNASGEIITRESRSSVDMELAVEWNVREIHNMDDLVQALGASNVSRVSDTEIKLLKDIQFSEQDVLSIILFMPELTIDFNGHFCKGLINFSVETGSVTLIDSTGTNSGGIKSSLIESEPSTFFAPDAVDVRAGKLTIMSGRYTSCCSAVCGFGGNLSIQGGIFEGTANLQNLAFGTIAVYAGMNTASITGGDFRGQYYTVICYREPIFEPEKSIRNPLQISGGSFLCADAWFGAVTYVDNGAEEFPDIYELLAENSFFTPYDIYKHNIEDEYNTYTQTYVRVMTREGVEGFVNRLYTKVLGREADPKGFANWVNQLKSKTISGSEAAYGFFFSPELTKRNLSNREFITLLYNVFLNRAPDNGGMNAWTTVLEAGASRKYVFSGFTNSQEWKGLCTDYQIDPGSYTSDEPRDQNLQVTAFVQRLYSLCLNRKAEVDGLNNWTAALLSKEQDGAHIAYGFFFSQEFVGRNLSNAEYVEVLYKVLLGRNSDPAGKADWVKQLDGGMARMDIFRGFVHSQEFDQICADYGIVRGSI